MNYKQIVDRLKEIVFRHKMLVDFGYGDLSDIKVKPQNDTNKGSDNADYPYAFLNPQSHSRVDNSVIYRFNLIVMEMSTDATDSVLTAQSNCAQYINDIVAMWHYGYQTDRTEVNLSYSMTPFKQRFQDTVAGMTAVLEITVADPLDNCLTPFAPIGSNEPTPEYGTLKVHATASQDYYIDPETGSISPTISQVFWFDNIIETDGNWDAYIRYNVPEAGTYNIVADVQITLTQPNESPEAVSPPPSILQIADGVATYITPSVVTGWPTAFVDTNTVYTAHLEWTITAPLNNYTLEYVRGTNSNQYYDLEYYEKAGSSIKIYKA